VVVAAGGDGTINGVVNGIAPLRERTRLGIIPMGTGNDFARSIGVPPNLEQAIDILAAGRERPLDLVQVASDTTRYFINVSSGGFSGLVDEMLTDEMKKTWGPLAYLRSAAAALPDLSAYHASFSFDDGPTEVFPAYNVVVANARFVAGGLLIAPEALVDDGLLDILIVPVASVPQLIALTPQLFLGRHLESNLIIFRRARTLQVDSQPGMWFNVDGELVGNEPAHFEVLPQALRVIVGPGALALSPQTTE
jgi:diacylglycerol kinase (ATP)